MFSEALSRPNCLCPALSSPVTRVMCKCNVRGQPGSHRAGAVGFKHGNICTYVHMWHFLKMCSKSHPLLVKINWECKGKGTLKFLQIRKRETTQHKHILVYVHTQPPSNSSHFSIKAYAVDLSRHYSDTIHLCQTAVPCITALPLQ